MLYALAIGFFQQTVMTFVRPIRMLGIGLLLSGLVYALLPISIVQMQMHYFAFLVVLMSVDGYFQSYVWPNLLMLINSSYDNKKDAIKLGFWSTNTNFGNILGFVIC